MRALLVAIFLVVTLGLTGPDAAQSFSATEWAIAGRMVQLRVTVPSAAARPLIGRAMPLAADAALAAYVLAHVDVHAAGASCPATDQGQGIGLIDRLAPRPGRFAYEIVFRCPGGGALRLDDHMLFAAAPAHLDFATLRSAGQPRVTRVYDLDHQSLTIPADGALQGSPAIVYVGLGLRHLSTSLARIGCVLILFWRPLRRADWIARATALAGGYALSIGLGLAAGPLPLPAGAEAMIGLLALVLALRQTRHRGIAAAAAGVLILLLAAIAVPAGQGTAIQLLGAAILAPCVLLARQAWVQLIPAALFGLLDGAAFGTATRAFVAPGWEAAVPLGGYAAGGLLAAVSLGALAWLSRRAPPLAAALGSGAIACCGMFWFVSHVRG